MKLLLIFCIFIEKEVVFVDMQKPFLKEVTCLSEDVKSVLPAADMLDHELTHLYSSVCKDHGSVHRFDQAFEHYEVGFFLDNPPKFPN